MLATMLISGGMLSGPGPVQAQGLCLCPLCALGLQKLYRQSTGAMSPALEPGDCLRIWTGAELPDAGALIAYRTTAGADNLMRVIALPGQRIAVVAGVPVIDGLPAKRERLADYRIAPDLAAGPLALCGESGGCDLPRFRETLPNGASYEVLDAVPGSTLDEMAEVTVPPAHVFVMGDHRDIAMDSRLGPELGGPGMVSLLLMVGVMAPETEPTAP